MHDKQTRKLIEFMDKEIQNTVRIGITGHRKLTEGQVLALEPVIKRAIENVIQYYENEHNSTPHIIFIRLRR